MYRFHRMKIEPILIEQKNSTFSFVREILIPLIPVVIAVISIILSTNYQRETIKTQIEMNQLQVTYNSKIDRYSDFLKAINIAIFSGYGSDLNTFRAETSDLEYAFFEIDPLLSKESSMVVWLDTENLSTLCTKMFFSIDKDDDEYNNILLSAFQLQSKIRDEIRKELFEESTNELPDNKP